MMPWKPATLAVVTHCKLDGQFSPAAAMRWTRSKLLLPYSKTIQLSTRAMARISISMAKSNATPSSMDAATLKAGSVAGLRHIKNPIRLARSVLEKSSHMMLIAEGAERFAAEHKLPLCNPEDLVSPAEREAWLRCSKDAHAAANHRGHDQGTVGAVAIDKQGRLFAATSTGGICCKLPGRVGDSPLIGCGCYADSETGGASSTGYGEAIMRIVMAKAATDSLSQPRASAMRSAQQAVQQLAARGRGTGGIILLDKNGDPGFCVQHPAYGLRLRRFRFFFYCGHLNMKTSSRLFLLLLLALGLFSLSAALSAQDASSTAQKDWPVYGGTSENNHYSTLDQINRTNVKQLKLAWSFDTQEPGGLQSSPIVVDGVLFGITPTQKIFALDAATGKLLWKFDSGIKGTQPDRGLAYWSDGKDNRIIVGVMNFVYALDATTGKPVANFGQRRAH